MVERVVVNRSFTLFKTFYEDGVATDPDGSPTVTVTRSDGTTVTTGAVTDETPDGTWSVTVPASENDLLDTLTVDWAATVNGEPQEYLDTVEVAGGVLFTVAEFRALGSAYANTTNYPTSAVTDMRTTVEQALEDACDVAFVPRYHQETFSGAATTKVRLRWPMVIAIRSLTINGTAVTPVDSLIDSDDNGIAYLSTGWTGGTGNITIGYEHGHPALKSRIKRAALILAKRWITPGSADDRAINVTTDAGTYALFQAGVRGHLFDVPEVQAAVDQYNRSMGVW